MTNRALPLLRMEAVPERSGLLAPFRSRAALASLTVLALALAVEVLPGWRGLRVLSTSPALEPSAASMAEPAASVGESLLPNETLTRAELGQPAHASLPRRANSPIAGDPSDALPPVQVDAREPPVPLTDATGKALDGFYRALSNTAKKRTSAVTRIAHFGDSVVASDYVSGTLRRKLQAEFGDAGHGFMLIANAWPSYFHNDVSRYATAGWNVSRVVGPYAADGLYGLGGVSFKADKNVLARFGTAKSGDFGRNVSRFELAYLEEPGGGSIQVSVDGSAKASVTSVGPAKKSAFFELHVEDGAHDFEIYTKGGVFRAFGAVLERDVPGVVLDALGIQGARIRFLDKEDDSHWAEQLAWRKPNLIIYEFGANESGDGFLYPMQDYHRTMKEVVAQGQRALPDAGCLVIGPMDRAAKVGDAIVSIRVIPFLVEEQKKAAAELGCAFFDTYAAMGGAHSMPSWVRRGLGQADLTHPTAVGSEVIGNWVFRALMQGFNGYLRSRNERAQAASDTE